MPLQLAGDLASGNMHGMPVASSAAKRSSLRSSRRTGPLVDPKKVYQVGIRSVDAREPRKMPSTASMSSICGPSTRCMAHIIRQIVDEVRAANGLLHVSLAVDFMDPELAPGVRDDGPGARDLPRLTSSWKCLCDSASSLPRCGRAQPVPRRPGQSARILGRTDASPFGPVSSTGAHARLKAMLPALLQGGNVQQKA